MTAEPELDDLDASLMCPVCLDLLFDPFGVIPCKHTFCETCLRRIGSKDPMNTFCPMCRQRIVYCEIQPELAMSIRESYPDLYKKRRTAEKSTNVYNLPLPWRPGWRNLVSGRALGGNPIGQVSHQHELSKNWPLGGAVNRICLFCLSSIFSASKFWPIFNCCLIFNLVYLVHFGLFLTARAFNSRS